MEEKANKLERIIRPIVEGQIRGFLKEHPVIVNAVDWYKPRRDKATTFTNSLAKRIVRDLTCGTQAARLRAALLECSAEAPSKSPLEFLAGGDGRLGTSLEPPGGVSGNATGHPTNPRLGGYTAQEYAAKAFPKDQWPKLFQSAHPLQAITDG
jgi:hypothetical protein